MSLTAIEALRHIQAELVKRDAEDVPAGFMTDLQWAEAWSLSRPHTSSLLKRASHHGLMEKRQFRIACGESLKKVWHYKQVAA